MLEKCKVFWPIEKFVSFAKIIWNPVLLLLVPNNWLKNPVHQSFNNHICSGTHNGSSSKFLFSPHLYPTKFMIISCLLAQWASVMTIFYYRKRNHIFFSTAPKLFDASWEEWRKFNYTTSNFPQYIMCQVSWSYCQAFQEL